MIDPERLSLRFRARLAFAEVCCHGALRVVGGDLWRLVHIAEAQKESVGKSPTNCGLRSQGVPCRGDVARSVPYQVSGRPAHRRLRSTRDNLNIAHWGSSIK